MIAFRGFIAGLFGASGEFDLPICDPFVLSGQGMTYEEWVVSQGYVLADLCGPVGGLYGEPFADGTCFADGSGFLIPEYEAPIVQSNAVAGAREINIGVGNGLVVGSYFSTSQNYLHMVTGFNGNNTIITPSLRRGVTVGDAINVNKPLIRVRLSNDEGGTLPIDFGRYTGPITLQVEEVLDRDDLNAPGNLTLVQV